MKDILINAFTSHPMFENITIENCMTMMNCLGCTQRDYKKDQILSPSEAYARQIGIVIRGRIHIIQEDIWGRNAFITYTDDKGIFGIPLLREKMADQGIIFKASEPTTVLFLPVDKILYPCKNSCPFHLQLTRNLFNLISHRNISLMEKIEITSKSSLREKVLAYLSLEAQKAGSTTITLPLNRTEMADYLCTNRSALSRELAKMKQEGIIDYKQRVFHLRNI